MADTFNRKAADEYERAADALPGRGAARPAAYSGQASSLAGERGERPENWTDLRTILAAVWYRRWLFVACMLVSSIGFVTLAQLMRPLYKAYTVLVPASYDRSALSGSLGTVLNQLGGLASLGGIGGGADMATAEAVAVLKSQQFTARFFDDFKIVPKLYPAKWDSVGGGWKVPPDKQPTLTQAFRLFDTKIRNVTQDRKTGLWTLQIEWKEPGEAATWANELVARVNAEMRDRAIENAVESIRFLQNELMSTQQIETRDAINRLIEAQLKQRMVATVTKEYAFRVVEKAAAPDLRDPASPNKPVLYILGPVVGFALGLLLLGLINMRSLLVPK